MTWRGAAWRSVAQLRAASPSTNAFASTSFSDPERRSPGSPIVGHHLRPHKRWMPTMRAAKWTAFQGCTGFEPGLTNCWMPARSAKSTDHSLNNPTILNKFKYTVANPINYKQIEELPQEQWLWSNPWYFFGKKYPTHGNFYVAKYKNHGDF